MELAIGDVVQLRSGGIRMTIKSIKPIHNEPENLEAECHWFESVGPYGGEKHEYSSFPIRMLTLVNSCLKAEA